MVKTTGPNSFTCMNDVWLIPQNKCMFHNSVFLFHFDSFTYSCDVKHDLEYTCL